MEGLFRPVIERSGHGNTGNPKELPKTVEEDLLDKIQEMSVEDAPSYSSEWKLC